MLSRGRDLSLPSFLAFALFRLGSGMTRIRAVLELFEPSLKSLTNLALT